MFRRERESLEKLREDKAGEVAGGKGPMGEPELYVEKWQSQPPVVRTSGSLKWLCGT